MDLPLRDGESVEQFACRQRTDEEHEAVQTSIFEREFSSVRREIKELFDRPGMIWGDSSAG